jgi:hypothetical protein
MAGKTHRDVSRFSNRRCKIERPTNTTRNVEPRVPSPCPLPQAGEGKTILPQAGEGKTILRKRERGKPFSRKRERGKPFSRKRERGKTILPSGRGEKPGLSQAGNETAAITEFAKSRSQHKRKIH